MVFALSRDHSWPTLSPSYLSPLCSANPYPHGHGQGMGYTSGRRGALTRIDVFAELEGGYITWARIPLVRMQERAHLARKWTSLALKKGNASGLLSPSPLQPGHLLIRREHTLSPREPAQAPSSRYAQLKGQDFWVMVGLPR